MLTMICDIALGMMCVKMMRKLRRAHHSAGLQYSLLFSVMTQRRAPCASGPGLVKRDGDDGVDRIPLPSIATTTMASSSPGKAQQDDNAG